MHDANLRTERPTFVTRLVCSSTGAEYVPDEVHGLSEAGKPLLVEYDLDGVGAATSPEDLAQRPDDMWKWRELLPVREVEHIVSLGEAATPIVRLRSTPGIGDGPVLVKDEGRLPTGSFKARGLGMAVSMAVELGIEKMAMPTNGNAGAALAAYGSAAGIETFVFCPADTPEVNVREIALQGARVWRVNGFINDCGKLVAAGKDSVGWFDVSTLKEPYRIEGKKTMGLELVEQLGWEVPDVIVYPTGGGTGLIGMWKAFNELRQLGWIGSKLPRMIAVQSSGCAPMVRAWEQGADHAEPWTDPDTVAMGIRVPVAIGDFLILDAIRASDGCAIAVDDEAIVRAQRDAASADGLLLCPEGAATLAAYRRGLESGRIDRDERAVLFNCGSGLKYPMPPMRRALDHTAPFDPAMFA